MFYKIIFTLAFMTTLFTQPTVANNINGSWHLRVMDGMEVRKARAILDFNMEDMKLSGFDACNRMCGDLVKISEHNTTIPMLKSTKMACRGNIFEWTRKYLHEALKEGFEIKEEKKYGVDGITLKSTNHELFFKKMRRKESPLWKL